ncbi:MAG TPA: IS1182 family transposase [Allosphingosinicella sp.]|nr:IS1182 family transposase [Allosphingosinicella sp.]
MMGTKARLFAPLPPVSLEELIPPDHFYRHLERSLDLGFVRDLVRDAYASSGRPSIDPVVFFKLQLILFFEGLRSERQLMQVVADRLSLRWYLGYDLSERLPDHSSLSRIRERYGLDVFRRFFDRIVEQCLTARLVWGEELYLDATRVQANAATDSLQPRFAVEAHLARLFAADRDEPGRGGAGDGPDEPDAGDAPTRLPVTLTEEACAALVECAADRRAWIGRAGRPDRATTSGPYRRTADFRVSTTDPDATPMPFGDKGTRLGYQNHYVVDGGRARIILTALVTPAEVQEHQPTLDLLWHTRFRWKVRPRQVTGDTKYGTIENIAAIERERIRAYVPLSAVGRRPGHFGMTDFVYDAGADTYRCPGHQRLRFISQCETTRRRIYEAPTGACAACRLRPECTTSKRGRRVGRSLEETYLDRVRSYHVTESYAKAMRKRQVWVEPLFAEAKDWHGLRRFRLRGLEKVNGEALLIAAGQNLKRLLSRWGWGRRPFPSGTRGAVLPTLPPGLTSVP